MPGARSSNFRPGDIAEKLAETILSFIVFTTHVSRENDVGHDFICVLPQREGNILKADMSFTVQVKAIGLRNRLVFSKPHQCEWLEKQDMPFFICLADNKNLRIDIFSTWNIHNSYLWKRSKSYKLLPGKSNDFPALPFPREEPECRRLQNIPLGKPIISVTMFDVVNKEKIEQFRMVLKDWVSLERENILRKSLSLKWIHGPIRYKTNFPLSTPEVYFQDTAYWNPNDIPDGLLYFTRSAVSLRNMMNRCRPVEETIDQWESKKEALDNVIKAFWSYLEPISQGALKEELGQFIIENN